MPNHADRFLIQDMALRYVARQNMFVRYEYEIRRYNNMSWHRDIDGVAIDLQAKIVWIVEVTTGPGGSLWYKIRNANVEYIDPLRQCMANDLSALGGNIAFGIWIFGKKKFGQDFRAAHAANVNAASIPFKFISLEDVAADLLS